MAIYVDFITDDIDEEIVRAFVDIIENIAYRKETFKTRRKRIV